AKFSGSEYCVYLCSTHRRMLPCSRAQSPLSGAFRGDCGFRGLARVHEAEDQVGEDADNDSAVGDVESGVPPGGQDAGNSERQMEIEEVDYVAMHESIQKVPEY